MIGGDKVVIFSKSWCPYCTEAKNLLKSLNIPFNVYELDQMNYVPAIQAILDDLTGMWTVPNIFIGGEFIGGLDSLKAK